MAEPEPILRVPLSVARRHEQEHVALSLECERLGDEAHAHRARVADLEFEVRGLKAQVRGHVRTNRSLRAVLRDGGIIVPPKLALTVATLIATGGAQHMFSPDVDSRTVVARAIRRLVAWFGWTPARASHELAQRRGRRTVAAVHAEQAVKSTTPAQVDLEEAIERAKAAAPTKPKRTRAKKPKAAPAAAVAVDDDDKGNGLRASLRALGLPEDWRVDDDLIGSGASGTPRVPATTKTPPTMPTKEQP